MKNRLFSVFFCILFFSLSGCCCKSNKADDATEITPVYVTFYSHNEDASYWEMLIDNKEMYKEYRSDLVDKVKLLYNYGAKLNWQTDHSVLEAMIKNETEDLFDSTGGKNILRWMVEDMGMSVDPHGHLKEYNLADIAYLIKQLGVDPSGVVGGFVLLDCGETEGEFTYNDYKDVLDVQEDGYIYGWIYPDEKWRPQILTQGSMAGHWFENYNSGIWRPCSAENFNEHCDEGDIIYVGQGYPHDTDNLSQSDSPTNPKVLYKDAEYIKELVSMIDNGVLPKGKIYTASVHLIDKPSYKDLSSTYDGLFKFLEEVKPLHEEGKIVFATYQEVVDIWKDNYGAEPNIVDFSLFSKYDDAMALVEDYCWGGSSSGCNDSGCPPDYVCDPGINECVPDCRSGNSCPDSRPNCDPDTGLCTP